MFFSQFFPQVIRECPSGSKVSDDDDSESGMRTEFYHLISSVCQNGDSSETEYSPSLSSIKLIQYEIPGLVNPSLPLIQCKKLPVFDE